LAGSTGLVRGWAAFGAAPQAALATVSPAFEKRAALASPMPGTHSTMSVQFLNAQVLRAARILPERPRPVPFTAWSSAWLALTGT